LLHLEVPTLRKLASIGVVSLAILLGTGSVASADPGQVVSPPPRTDAFMPGKACLHANLIANRSFGANDLTGVVGAGTPPTCTGGGGGGGGGSG
jgi:hypothetical protein